MASEVHPVERTRDAAVPKPRCFCRHKTTGKSSADRFLGGCLEKGNGLWSIQVGFDSEADAKKLASAVLAKPKERFSGFAAQREFWFGSVVAAKIARALRS